MIDKRRFWAGCLLFSSVVITLLMGGIVISEFGFDARCTWTVVGIVILLAVIIYERRK